ncbi:MAG: hypothetical protein EZS28_004529 [Streblomastix strix]|uniref:Protein kinase domain-containing protein n=1 Tax=Streblomastix strix TaxID=222440 RepID=A0A5J4X015_9EUKA|nr:MAG: hypothetical protein EZS28_004529 [Streblomastix strix]
MHENGLIHGNIKEQNILLHTPLGSDRVQVKLTDFELVNVQKDDDQNTTQMSIAGTLPYLPPELLLGTEEDGDKVKADSKADIYDVAEIGSTNYYQRQHYLGFAVKDAFIRLKEKDFSF